MVLSRYRYNPNAPVGGSGESNAAMNLKKGLYPATIVSVGEPEYSQFLNEKRQEYPLQIKLVFELDGLGLTTSAWVTLPFDKPNGEPGDIHPKSSLGKLLVAITGEDITKDTDLDDSMLDGAHVTLALEAKPNGYMRVADYFPGQTPGTGTMAPSQVAQRTAPPAPQRPAPSVVPMRPQPPQRPAAPGRPVYNAAPADDEPFD